ncbi:hypothetical protein NL676_035007 [Syzygium grande]|nr:hypothetical protein NL676_035007 [Syzygium grande]
MVRAVDPARSPGLKNVPEMRLDHLERLWAKGTAEDLPGEAAKVESGLDGRFWTVDVQLVSRLRYDPGACLNDLRTNLQQMRLQT